MGEKPKGIGHFSGGREFCKFPQAIHERRGFLQMLLGIGNDFSFQVGLLFAVAPGREAQRSNNKQPS
jgi:hypothetical protein